MSLLRKMRRRDEGIAIVAAIGVAFVVMALLVILVSVTIAAARASDRERERTEAVHSAEGAIDATMAELEHSTPCGAPSFSPLTTGYGTQAMTTTVTITYYRSDFTTVVSCSGGVLSSEPAYAIVKATTKPTATDVGVKPTRVIEARVALKSRGGSTKLPGLYSAGDMVLEGTPDVFSQVADGNPDIWIENGDLTCRTTTNRQLEIEAEVVVAHGDAYIQEYCWFDRGFWVDGNTTFDDTEASSTSQVNLRCNNHYLCGDFTSGGNLRIDTSASTEYLTAAGDVTLGGTVTSGASKLRTDGILTQNDPDVENRPARTFPSIQYNYNNWQSAYGMSEGTLANFVSRLVWNKRTTTQYYNSTYVAGCNFNSTYYNTTITLTTTPMVYDLRESSTGCSSVKFSGTNTIVVKADTAFMVTGFFNSGTLNFVSGDGAKHNVWIIVPDQGVPAYTGGAVACTTATRYNLCSTNILTSTADVPIMWYTKHLFYSDGKSNSVNDMYGQVFAGSIYFKGYLDLQFETLTVPGEILWVPGDPGFDVQLLEKSESSSS